MPFRDKVKRAFGRNSNEDSDLTTVSSATSRKEKKQKREYPDNVYKPGEVMPRPKYRAAYNKEHQEKLSAFSFGDAWKRRKSDQSQYSPMGSRLPSMVGSLRRMSLATGSRDRKQSVATETVDENIDRDDDVSNVGLSRQVTRDENGRPRTADSRKMNGLHSQRTVTNGHVKSGETEKPFTEEELSLALTRTTVKDGAGA
ncbi:hypothetical protein MMC07_001845 [Pseudocyphellaria aurata]|nr:hypothetical protein [Pseudocyphellaria aurata]